MMYAILGVCVHFLVRGGEYINELGEILTMN